ncbi:two-component system, sensor histidine kinase YesM [Paenibacillus sp. UNCCL117]|uniref:sensor histidine kinase n=1 Tax=unclassified Paenibacillus TaxID=185978 RepID=UPI0008900BA4|nr:MULTISPECIES: histidine kinase [unclassified Paenibacillus]SDE26531.1 two-component system, sensor histidine kinase YesM [Paenibacillus sp. cl123]SFW62647.1 two-component system, sensor histidine kinase YesM [Paenibacillus sp. UNCCL117]
MRSNWKVKRFSIFNKLVLAFLVVISPLYLLGMFMNEKGAQMIHDGVFQSQKQKVEFYLTSLETEIERMIVLQRHFMNDTDLQTLSTIVDRLTVYERLAAMNRLQERLRLIKESSPYIAQAKAYIPSVSRIVSSGDTVDRLDPEHLEQLKSEALRFEPPFVMSGDKLAIRDYYPNPYNLDKRNPAFVLELEVSLPAIMQYLRQLPGYDSGGAALINSDTIIVNENVKASFDEIRVQLNEVLAAAAAGTGIDGQKVSTARLFTPGGDVFLTVFIRSAKLNSSLIVYVPESEVLGPIRKYRSYMWLISGLSAVVIVVFAYWIYRVIHRPLRKLVRAFLRVETGVMRVDIKHGSNDEFRYLYEKFNHMVEHLNMLIYETYEQKIHLQQAELKQLQSQINPHFLYNSFYLLYRMTKAHDYDNATRFTQFLGDYYQYITRNGKEEVRLEEELGHVKAYIEIQSIRFHDRIQVEMLPVAERFCQAIVPRLILQPIIENAYQHGFDYDGDDCRLYIEVNENRSPVGMPLLTIVVRDNGQGMTEEQLAKWNRALANERHTEEVTGMMNVHRRLRLKYGENAGLRLDRGEASGLIVQIDIPFWTAESGEHVGSQEKGEI